MSRTVAGILDLLMAVEPDNFKIPVIAKSLQFVMTPVSYQKLCIELGRQVKTYKNRKVKVLQGKGERIVYKHKNN